MNSLSQNEMMFNFQDKSIRVELHNGEPLFCLPDVAQVLNIKNANSSRFNLNKAGVHEMYISHVSGKKLATFINEPNLYRVIFRSNKTEAVQFQDWVFEEVLPTIRKTGSYTARQSIYEELNRLHLEEKLSSAKGSFFGRGLYERKLEKNVLSVKILNCTAKLQLSFGGV